MSSDPMYSDRIGEKLIIFLVQCSLCQAINNIYIYIVYIRLFYWVNLALIHLQNEMRLQHGMNDCHIFIQFIQVAWRWIKINVVITKYRYHSFFFPFWQFYSGSCNVYVFFIEFNWLRHNTSNMTAKMY